MFQKVVATPHCDPDIHVAFGEGSLCPLVASCQCVHVKWPTGPPACLPCGHHRAPSRLAGPHCLVRQALPSTTAAHLWPHGPQGVGPRLFPPPPTGLPVSSRAVYVNLGEGPPGPSCAPALRSRDPHPAGRAPGRLLSPPRPSMGLEPTSVPLSPTSPCLLRPVPGTDSPVTHRWGLASWSLECPVS